MATRGRDVIVDTVHVLLAAGSDITTTASNFLHEEISLLDYLLDLVDIDCWQRRDRLELPMYTHRLQLVAELMQLLVTNGATLRRHPLYWQVQIIYQTATPADYLLSMNNSDLIDANNVIIDLWCDISRVFLLSGVQCFFVTDRFACSLIDKQRRVNFIQIFIRSFSVIVDSSPQSSLSMRLIRILLDILGKKGVTRLESMFMFEIHYKAKTRNSPQYETQINNTLTWMRGLQPRINSLQHIARQTILRAMSYRSLYGVETLGLPVHLKRYVLLQSTGE